MINFHNINKSFGSLRVLKGVSAEIYEGEIVCIVGPSGAGKTTLLQIMGTLDSFDGKHTDSYLEIDGQDVGQLKDKELSKFRNRNIGFIFQFHQLLEEFTALENVCLPAMIAGENLSQCKDRAMDLLEFIGLKERAGHLPSELSGGEAQRVAIARALINNPKVILADEPSGNLDSVNAQQLHQLFLSLRDKYKQTFVIVTHNAELADMADRKFEMRDGQLENITILKQ